MLFPVRAAPSLIVNKLWDVSGPPFPMAIAEELPQDATVWHGQNLAAESSVDARGMTSLHQME